MNHVSNLRFSTICGLLNKDLPLGDHSLAALIPETQQQVDCPECKQIFELGQNDNK